MTLVGSHYIVYVIQCMSVHWPRPGGSETPLVAATRNVGLYKWVWQLEWWPVGRYWKLE